MKLTYRILRHSDGFTAWAWSDDGCVCLKTPIHPTYLLARADLAMAVAKHAPGDARLHYFDGEYDVRPGYATDGTYCMKGTDQ